MRSKIRKTELVAFMLLLSPLAANADLIQYSFTGFDGGDGWTAAGAVVFDDADLAPAVDLGLLVQSFEFTWTNGLDTFISDTLAGGFIHFVLDGALNVDPSLTSICTGICDFGGAVFVFDGTVTYPAYWFATFGSEFEQTTLGSYEWSWSGPESVAIPEPGTLVLLGIGLLGMAAARCRRIA